MRRTRASRLPHRRRREGKTDYRLRLKLLRSGKKRLVVRKFNKNLVCQVVEHGPKGDRMVFSTEARELRGFGWKAGLGNIPAAYLTGLLCGIRGKGSECILDLGLQTSTKGSKLYAALKGAADGGVKVPFSEDNFPAPERLKGKHIADYAGKAGASFSGYKKAGINPKDIAKHFEEVKAKIVKSGGKVTSSGKKPAAGAKAGKTRKAVAKRGAKKVRAGTGKKA